MPMDVDGGFNHYTRAGVHAVTVDMRLMLTVT